VLEKRAQAPELGSVAKLVSGQVEALPLLK
jgi:hypothetical protein